MYVTPYARGEKLAGMADRLADIVLEKQQEGFEVVVMGDLNAHFDSNRVALDSRASAVENLSRVANLTVINWQPGLQKSGHGVVGASNQP